MKMLVFKNNLVVFRENLLHKAIQMYWNGKGSNHQDDSSFQMSYSPSDEATLESASTLRKDTIIRKLDDIGNSIKVRVMGYESENVLIHSPKSLHMRIC